MNSPGKDIGDPAGSREEAGGKNVDMASLRRIDPLGGDPADLDYWRQSWRLFNASSRRQYGPEASQVDADTLLEHRRRTGDTFAHIVATERDVVVGRLDLVVNPREDPGVVHAHFEVMPPWRGQGLGQQLWHAAQEILPTMGAHTMHAVSTVPVGADDDASLHLLTKNGFTPSARAIVSELDLAGNVPQPPLPAGYSMRVVADLPPDEDMPALAELNQLLDTDEPLFDRPPVADRWSPENLKASYQRAASLGARHVTVLVTHDESGEVVAMSENAWSPSHSHTMQQGGTYVRQGHRGRGIATAAKAKAIAAMKGIAVGAQVMRTTAAEDNVTMNAVNDTIGFKPTYLLTEWTREL